MTGIPPDDAIRVADPGAAVREWFARLGRACAAVDYGAGRALFAPDVVSFGTRADVVTGLGPLQADQWEGVWPTIDGFGFDLERIRAAGDERLAWGAATWTSTGYDESGRPFPRRGRATVVLQRRDGAWLAVHTHFSLVPGTPPRSFGRKGPGGGDRGGA